jgi:hypothetical protein
VLSWDEQANLPWSPFAMEVRSTYSSAMGKGLWGSSHGRENMASIPARSFTVERKSSRGGREGCGGTSPGMVAPRPVTVARGAGLPGGAPSSGGLHLGRKRGPADTSEGLPGDV